MTQPGIFTQLMTAAEERPWLWIIYLLTVGLPVGLVVLFCWPKVRYSMKSIQAPEELLHGSKE